MRFPVHPFSLDRHGNRRDLARPFYLSADELETLKNESFRSVWDRGEVKDLATNEEVSGLEVTDPWGHTLFDLMKPPRSA